MSNDLLADPFDGGTALPSARGRQSQSDLEFVRELVDEDLPVLLNPPAVGAQAQQLSRLGYQHHQIARLIASGAKHVAICAITGYSQSYISNLSRDADFVALVDYYAENEELIHVDAIKRLRDLGVCAVEELQSRIDAEPDKWSKRELMEIAELGIVKPHNAKNGSAGGPGGVSVGITFVQPPGGPVIDMEPQEN